MADHQSPEPAFICQTAELEGDDQVRAWIALCRDLAFAKGCTFPRLSWLDSPIGGNTIYLYEAWLTVPEDQGQPRFALVTP